MEIEDDNMDIYVLDYSIMIPHMDDDIYDECNMNMDMDSMNKNNDMVLFLLNIYPVDL